MSSAIDTLKWSCRANTPSVIEKLRDHKTQSTNVNLQALKTIFKGLHGAASLPHMAAETGLSEEAVVAAIVGLGSWITRARAKSGVDIVFLNPDTAQVRYAQDKGLDSAPPLQMQMLVNSSGVPEGLKKGVANSYVPEVPQSKSNGIWKKGKSGNLEVPVYGNVVIVHASLSPEAIGKDIKGSLAEIIAACPTEADLARYIQRTSEREKLLAYEHVTLAWLFCRLGRIDDLAEVNPGSASVSHRFADAYEVLELGRIRAMKAMHTLCEPEVSLDAVRDALVVLRPVAEALVRPLEGLAAKATESSEKALRTELRWLRRQVDTNAAALVCQSVAQLNEGQVLRIAQAAGLHTEGSTRSEESSIRTRLANMGLSSDADQLVGTGVQAQRLGLETEFWEAVERRADGDPKWDAVLVSQMRAH